MNMLLFAGFGVLVALATVSVFKKEQYVLLFPFLFVVLGQLARLPINISRIGILMSDIIIPLIVGLWFTKKLVMDRELPKSSIGPYLLAFALALIFSLLINLPTLPQSEWAISTFYLVRHLSYLGFFYVAFEAWKSIRTKEALRGVLIAGGLVGILGILQFIFIPDFTFMAIEQGWDPHIGRLLSTWYDPNFVAGFFSLIITIGISSWYMKKDQWKDYRTPLLCLLLAVCFLLTFSRSGMVALGLSILVVGVLEMKSLLIIGLVGLLVGLQVSERFAERFNDMVNSGLALVTGSLEHDVDITSQERLSSWNEVGELVGDSMIFGIGFNTIKFKKLDKGLVASPNDHAASGSDSSLLNIYITSGVVGVIVFLAFLYKVLMVSTFIYTKKTLPGHIRGFALGMLATVISLFFHSFFVNSLLYPLFLMVLIPLIALLDVEYQRATSSLPQ